MSNVKQGKEGNGPASIVVGRLQHTLLWNFMLRQLPGWERLFMNVVLPKQKFISSTDTEVPKAFNIHLKVTLTTQAFYSTDEVMEFN